MYKPNSQIKFCTCASTQKKSWLTIGDGVVDIEEYKKTHYIWTLYKYVGEKDDLMMGSVIMPVESLNDDLTAEDLTHQLNSTNPFDFDYKASKGDNLQIREEYIYKSMKGKPRADLDDYMSFIFRNGKWAEEVYDVFADKIRKFKTGN